MEVTRDMIIELTEDEIDEVSGARSGIGGTIGGIGLGIGLGAMGVDGFTAGTIGGLGGYAGGHAFGMVADIAGGNSPGSGGST